MNDLSVNENDKKNLDAHAVKIVPIDNMPSLGCKSFHIATGFAA